MPQIGLFGKHAREICLNEEDGEWWAKDIKKGKTDAWIALLLALTPNLTRLEIQFPLHSTRWVRRVVDWAIEGRFKTPVLANAEDVFISAHWSQFSNEGEGKDEVVTDWALPFLALPSLKRFGSEARCARCITKSMNPSRNHQPRILHSGIVAGLKMSRRSARSSRIFSPIATRVGSLRCPLCGSTMRC
ncbi:hypothetical protein BJX70DRAFT_374890 [Aspergillus crustosus]